MMRIYYENSNGEVLNLLSPPYCLQTGDLFDYAWSYETTGSRITKFLKEVQEKNLLLSILNYSRQDYMDAINRFSEVVETDVLVGMPGKLWVGEMYLQCYVIVSEKSDWEDDIELIDNEITLATDYPYWCRDKTYHFYASPGQIIENENRQEIVSVARSSQPGIDYPWDYTYDFVTHYRPTVRRVMYDYTYDFYHDHTVGRIDNDHFTDADFEMIVYGPCTHPEIRIGDNIYRVETTLYDSEYLVINSIKRTVIKYGRNGVTENLFNARDKYNCVFERIPAGNSTVKWNAQYSFDVILFQRRSEPLWTM